MDWAQTWTIIGVLGSLILGVGGIAITVLIGMRSENRTAHEQINKRIDDGLAGVHKRIDDGNAALQARIDDGLAGVHKRIDDGNAALHDGLAGVHKRIDDGNAVIHKRIDDLRELVLTLVRGASTRPDTDQESAP